MEHLTLPLELSIKIQQEMPAGTALETARTIHGVSFDGTGNIDLTEVIQDTVGAMFSSNTETDITVTYQDGDGTIDLVVSDISTILLLHSQLQELSVVFLLMELQI